MMSTKKCPYCSEEIQANAAKCRYCSEWINKVIDGTDKPDPVDIAEENQDTIPTQNTVVSETPPQKQPMNNEARPQLIKQDFKLAKILSLSVIILPVLLLILWYNLIITRDSSLVATLSIISFLLASVLVISTEYLLQMLNKYMQNFGISHNFGKNIRILQICLPFGAIFTLLALIGELDGHQSYILKGIGALFLLICYPTFPLAGKCIYNLWQRDYVGGCHVLGGVMIYGILISPLWLSVPVFLYKVFSNAEKYNKKIDTPIIDTISETEDLLLNKQNFTKGILACITLMFSPFFILLGTISVSSGSILFVSLGLVGAFILYEYMLYMLSKYMQNFKISANFRINMICVMVSSAFLVISFIIYPLLNTQLVSSWLIYISMTATWISFFLAGKCIYDLDNDDFVGESSSLGGLMFYGLIMPILWIFAPILIIHVFWRARKYSNKHGFRE